LVAPSPWEIEMARGQSGLMRSRTRGPYDCKETCEAAMDSRYTQESTSSEYVRSKDQLAEDSIRKPRLGEGLAFREKI